MSQLIRIAKSSSDWTMHDLNAYNISVISVINQDATAFFGCSVLPEPTHIHGEVLTAPCAKQAVSPDARELLCHMDHAMLVLEDVESAVVDFVVLLLRALGYTKRGRFFRTRQDIHYVICGESRLATADVSIIENNEILLVGLEGKQPIDLGGPTPQLTALAIAAFAANNDFRVSVLGQRPLPSKVMLGFSKTAIYPVFYKILVTEELVTAVERGLYSATPTVVYAHKRTLPNPRHRENGMIPSDNKRAILSCFEAFHDFVDYDL
ncbi:hypothetical protein J3A83DRAFT_3219578 [Scleroderma citrinum]